MAVASAWSTLTKSQLYNLGEAQNLEKRIEVRDFGVERLVREVDELRQLRHRRRHLPKGFRVHPKLIV